MTFSPVFQRPFAATFDRRAAAAAVAADWWEAGGAPTPVAVYQPKGAASLAASYVNLANPGTYDAAPGVAPTHAALTGWTLNGSTQWLDTSLVPSSTWTTLIRFANASGSSAQGLCGTYGDGGAAEERFGVFRLLAGVTYFSNYGLGAAASAYTEGVLALAGKYCYVNGSLVATISDATSIAATLSIAIGKLNGSVYFCPCDIQAVVIWDTLTDHATWVPAVSAAVATL